MRGIKEFLSPTTLEEALKLLDQHNEKAHILAGGTHLALVKSSSKPIIIDIKKAGLSEIKQDGEFTTIGATVRPKELIESPLITSIADGIIVQAAHRVGSTLTYNLVTVGGNICSPFPWSNLPSALLVLDAVIELSSINGTRILSLADFLAGNPKKMLQSNELLTAVKIPKASESKRTSYLAFSITEQDYDLAMIAVGMNLGNDCCSDVRIALGAAVSPSRLLNEASALLEGENLTDDLIEVISTKAVENLNVDKDIRTSKEHRLQVVKTLVKRALKEIRG